MFSLNSHSLEGHGTEGGEGIRLTFSVAKKMSMEWVKQTALITSSADKEEWISLIDKSILVILENERCFLPLNESQKREALENECYSYKEAKKIGLNYFSDVLAYTKPLAKKIQPSIYLVSNQLQKINIDVPMATLIILHETGHHLGLSVSNVFTSIDQLADEISYSIYVEMMARNNTSKKLDRFLEEIKKEKNTINNKKVTYGFYKDPDTINESFKRVKQRKPKTFSIKLNAKQSIEVPPRHVLLVDEDEIYTYSDEEFFKERIGLTKDYIYIYSGRNGLKIEKGMEYNFLRKEGTDYTVKVNDSFEVYGLFYKSELEDIKRSLNALFN